MLSPEMQIATDKVLENHSDLFKKLAEQEEKDKLMLAESTRPVIDVPNEVVAAAPSEVVSPTPETQQRAQSPEMDAAQFIMVKLPVFRQMVDKITGVQAKRVLSRLVEAPLEDETGPFTTQDAADTYNLGMMIQNAKHILFLASIKAPDAEQVVQRGLDEEKLKLEAAENASVNVSNNSELKE